jgi:cytochrome c oxidase subunit 2
MFRGQSSVTSRANLLSTRGGLAALGAFVGMLLLQSQAFANMLPLQGTDVSVRWDHLYEFLLWLSVFFFVLVVGAMLVFAVKYRASQPGLRTKYITGNHLLEAAWIAVPTVLLMVIFVWGFSVYHGMTAAPSDAYEIKVIAKQWVWQFQYDNGKTTSSDLYVPLNKPVRLLMTSEDVLHSFFVPNFRIKQDVVPGMYTGVWFEARVPGKHQIFCAEYCGTSHSGMLGKVVVLDPQQWKDWNAGKKLGPIPNAGSELTQADIDEWKSQGGGQSTITPLSLVAQGKSHFETKGCTSCHTVDGTSKIGPSLKGIFGSQVALNDGSLVKADENYLRESIELPSAKLVRGYQPLMPTFKGVLNASELNALVAYIKSLK